nr:Interferon inducible double stranded [Hymenolepis microstoma]
MLTPSNQTPIEILQEYASKKSLIVHYEMVANEGEAHEPIYVFQCRVGKVSACGKGPSKKKAKHLAAYYVLLQVISQSPTSQTDRAALSAMKSSLAVLGIDINGDDSNIESLSAAATRTQFNYVSKVQEYCDKNMWPPPTYEFKDSSDSIILGGKFQCKIHLWRWEFIAYGNSKKEAKRKVAAEFVKEVVEQGLTIPSEAIEAMEEENLPLVDKQDLNKLKVRQSTQETANKLTRKILSGIYTAKGKVSNVNVENFASPFLDVYAELHRVLEENKITVFYSYIAKTKSGKIYCQAQLSTIPPQVTCSRPCENVDQARLDAAYKCLIYLHTMSKKSPILDEELWFGRTYI